MTAPEPAPPPGSREAFLAKIRAAEAVQFAELHAVQRRRLFIQQICFFLLLLALWQVPLHNPVKMLVVLFHELSHAFVAYATGGMVFGIAIDPRGAGITIGLGGWLTAIAAAGYVGSLLFGAVLYYLCALWSSREVWVALTLTAYLTWMVPFFNGFTGHFLIGTLTLLTAGIWLRAGLQKGLLRVIATASCLYPILDVAGEIITQERAGFRFNGNLIGSDLGQMATITGLPMAGLVLFWIVLGGATVGWVMSRTADLDARTEVKRSLVPRKPAKPAPGFQVEKRLVYHKSGPYSSDYTIR